MTKVQIIRAYRDLFAQEAAEVVMEDLKKFCYEGRTTLVMGDPQTTGWNEGKRTVLLHIRGRLDDETLRRAIQEEEKSR